MTHDMDNVEAKAAVEDPLFQKICQRYGLPTARGEYLARNELLGWSSNELSVSLDKINGLPTISDTVERPRFWQAQQWVKPSSTLVERAANEQLALCINASGDWQLLDKDYVALSHVWDEGLYADARNRGLPRGVVEQLFSMMEPLNAKWLWLDSLAVPGGRRDLTLEEEIVKTKLINNMDKVYRNAEFVVILDALLLELQSRDPVDVGVAILFGKWVSRVWTYQEVKLASRALILTSAGFVDVRHIVEQLGVLAQQDRSTFSRLHESLKRLQSSDTSSRASILDIALSSANRSAGHDIDHCRGFFPCLGLKWNERFSRDHGMQHIMESRKDEAPLLLGLHGSPLLAEGYAWAPAYLCGLNGTPLLNVSWEAKGLRRVWYSYRVTLNLEKQIPESARGGLVLGIEGSGRMVVCACALSHRERLEAINDFKLAIENQSAFILSGSSFETLAEYRTLGPPPTILLVKQANVGNEAFIYMTAGLLALSTGLPASPKEWLIYHQSPLLEVRQSSNRYPPATSATVNIVLPHDGESPLHTATRLSNFAEIRRLIARHCDIDAEDAAGWTPLHIASYLGHLQVVQILLASGASVSHTEHDGGYAALHLAMMPGNLESVKALLGAKAPPNRTTTSRQTPLMLAAQLGALDVVQELLNAGARVDFACLPGSATPLHRAVEGGNAAILRLLLKCPEAVDILYWKDANGNSAARLAFNKFDLDMQAPLINRMPFFGAIETFAVMSVWLPLLSLVTSLALDFGLLILNGRVNTAMSPFLASLWTRFGTPVLWIFHIFVLFATRKGRFLLPLFWALLFLIRSLPLESFTQANEAEPFRWSTDTVFFSRMLVLIVSVFKLCWLVVRNLALYMSCALITGWLFRYIREFIQG